MWNCVSDCYYKVVNEVNKVFGLIKWIIGCEKKEVFFLLF